MQRRSILTSAATVVVAATAIAGGAYISAEAMDTGQPSRLATICMVTVNWVPIDRRYGRQGINCKTA